MSDIGSEVKRGPGRPPMRPEASRAPLRDRLRGKKRHEAIHTDRFHVPESDLIEGVSFEWKRVSVSGQEDPAYIGAQRRQGWEPVYAEDMPSLALDGYEGAIIKEGLQLMARPQELTDRANKEAQEASRRALLDRQVQMGVAPSGHLQRHAPSIDSQVMRPVRVEE